MGALTEEEERAQNLYLDSDTKFSSDFKNQVGFVFGPIIALIDCIHDPLFAGGKTLDPELVEILDWGRKLFEDGGPTAILQAKHAFNDQVFEDLLHNVPRLIHFLPKYITSEVAKQIVLDPVAEAAAVDTGKVYPIAEEVAYLVDKEGISIGELARGIQVNPELLRNAEPFSRRVGSMTTSKSGTEMEGKLFWDVVCLVIRTLRRFIKKTEAGTAQRSDRFRIQPVNLEPMVTIWTETWIEWSDRYGKGR